jgi:16S rRNA processing protein RimM
MSTSEKTAAPKAGASLVLLGRISAAQGLKGEVRLTSFTGVPQDVAAYGPLTDEAGRRFIIESLRVIKGGVLAVRLAGVADRSAAEALKGTALYVEKARLPATEEDEWYHEDLIGLPALSVAGDRIGEIVAVQNYGAGDLLEIRLTDSRQTVFVPFTQDAVPEVDVKAKRVVVIPPEEFDEPDE